MVNIIINKDVIFTDTSTNGPNKYDWIWGDGTQALGVTSNPAIHRYSTAGTYTVRHKAYNAAGASGEATAPIIATSGIIEYTITVQVNDLTRGRISINDGVPDEHPQTLKVAAGGPFKLEAIPNLTMAFSNWKDQNGTNYNGEIVTGNANMNMSFTAYFNPIVPGLKWKCSGTPDYVCTQSADGTYNTEAECKAGCSGGDNGLFSLAIIAGSFVIQQLITKKK